MLTIIWDVDDVLNDLMRAWLEQEWNARHPECSVSYEELRVNPPHSVIGITQETYLRSLDEFRAARMTDMMPLPEAKGWFERHGAKHRNIALTAVPLRSAPTSAEWVLRHFGRWIRSFHFVPSARADEEFPLYDRTKQDFLRSCPDECVLVDDRPEHVASARDLGIRAYLMPRPWNSEKKSISEVFQELGNL
jgi:FMN phosphatase YigB (HAD superfamily)